MNDIVEDELPPPPENTAAEDVTVKYVCAESGTLTSFVPFSTLSLDLIHLLRPHLRTATFAAGELILRQGEIGTSLILIVDGVVEISTRDDLANRYFIGRVSAGGIVGEMSLLTREPRTADVIATDSVNALVLPVDQFHQMARQYPELSVVLTQLVSTRLGGPERDVLAGKVLHGYRIERRLGRGGMGIVYEAEQCATGQRVALKMMSHRLVYDYKALAQFQHEADLVESFDHENVVSVYGRFAAFHTFFIAMELCDGKPLSELIARNGALVEDECRKILGQLTKALVYAHAAGVIHRDVKPANILVGRDGRVRLADFGLARPIAESEQVSQNLIVGTLQYMAPEQLFTGELDQRADLFSLGCVAYEMLTGKPLFVAADHRELFRQRAAWTTPDFSSSLSNVSGPMQQVLQQCLEVEPSRRDPDLRLLQSWADALESPSALFE